MSEYTTYVRRRHRKDTRRSVLPVHDPAWQKAGSKMIVYILFNPVDNLCLRTLVKGTLRRVEHLLHDMLFTAGKDEIDIRNKLYIRTNQSLETFLRIFRNLLEFVNGDIAPLFG